jgi:hypothetical protein
MPRPHPPRPLPLLAEQDWTRRDAARIAGGRALLTRTLGTGPVGQYQLQAWIAALHDEAPTAEETDWPQILALSDGRTRVAPPGPMVTLSRAVALATVPGPTAGWPARRPRRQRPDGAGPPTGRRLGAAARTGRAPRRCRPDDRQRGGTALPSHQSRAHRDARRTGRAVMTVEFTGTVRRWKEDRPGGLTVVDIPADLVAPLGGRRQMRVTGTVNDAPFTGSTMLVAGGGLCVGVSKANLKAAGAALGDAVRLSIERAVVPGS